MDRELLLKRKSTPKHVAPDGPRMPQDGPRRFPGGPRTLLQFCFYNSRQNDSDTCSTHGGLPLFFLLGLRLGGEIHAGSPWGRLGAPLKYEYELLLEKKSWEGGVWKGRGRSWSRLYRRVAEFCFRCFQVLSKVLVLDGVVLLLEGVLDGDLDPSWRSLGN